jgi:hypothetical protein
MAGSPIFRMFHMGNLLGGQKKEEPEGALFESVPNWAPYCYSTFYKI